MLFRTLLSICLVAAGLTLASTCGLAHAQALISPVVVDFTPKTKVVSVSVSLAASAPRPVLFQAEVQRWEQADGERRLSDTDDVLVSPAIVELSPGKAQVFRLALRRQRPETMEATYRFVLEDVKVVDPADVKQGSITFRFRYDLPIFVAPRAPAVVSAGWSQCVETSGKGCLRLENNGNRRIQLTKLSVEGKGWKQEIKDGGTVLAGAWKQWTFDRPANHSGPLTLKAETSAGPLSAETSAGPLSAEVAAPSR